MSYNNKVAGKDKIKVLQIVSVSFSLKYFIGNQFKYFKEKGYHFTVACSPSDELFNYAKEMQFDSARFKILRSINPVQDIITIYKLYKFIKQEKFDVVIAHSPKGGLIGMVAAYLAKSPKKIFFRHGLVFETEKGFKKSILINIERLIGLCADRVVHVSQSLLDVSEKLSLSSKSKNLILNKGACNGVDTEKYKFRDKIKYRESFVIGFVGRLCRDKGIEELVKAFELLIQRDLNLKLLLVGPIDVRAGLDENIYNCIINNQNIEYTGETEDPSLYYNEMDLFILPSYREGFGMVNLEAAASELPVITTRSTGCINSIVENETGIFTEINPVSIADSIEYYIKNADMRRLHGKNGRKFVEENFSESIMYKEIENKVLLCQS